MPGIYGDFRSVRSTVSAAVLVDFAAARGMARSEALEGSAISESDLSNPDIEISVDQEMQIVRNILAGEKDERGIGLMAGLQTNLAMLGSLAIVLSTCATVREMVEVWVHYAELSFVYVRYNLDYQGPVVRISLDAGHLPEDVRRFAIERDLATLRMVQRGLLDWDMAVRRLEVEYEECPVYEAVGTLLGVDEILFSAQRTCLFLEASEFDRPMPQANPVIMQQYERMCADTLRRRQELNGLSGQVRQLLVHRGGVADQRTVAADLGLSLRTLRRRLAEENTTFRALSSEITGILAAELLASGLTVETVATRLGYSSVSAFGAVFRAEIGMPPGQFARANRQSARQ